MPKPAGPSQGSTQTSSASGFGMILVTLGGAVGTGARYLLDSALPSWAGLPVSTIGINVLGAFLLGALLTRLRQAAAEGAPAVRLERLRLLVGTGLLGGFTTYSALSIDTALLLASHPARAVGYALFTVLVGAGASVLGIWSASPRAETGADRGSE